jgi:sec-independent protein translocase protein TatA
LVGLDNPIHIAFVLVILLLVFGAKRLPEMGHSLGSGLRSFKQSITGEHTDELPATTSVTAERERAAGPADQAETRLAA